MRSNFVQRRDHRDAVWCRRGLGAGYTAWQSRGAEHRQAKRHRAARSAARPQCDAAAGGRAAGRRQQYVQPVPGAMPGSDTVPSTLSEKNAADDKLITVAWTFKNLTDEQRRAIYQALKDHPVRSAFNADVGTELPPTMELQAMPDAVVAQVPQTKGYQFAVSDNRVLLVSPPTRIVVGVLPDAKGLETTGGRHSPQQ